MSTLSSRHLIYVVMQRDLKLALRRKSDTITPLFFFVIVISLIPLGVGAEHETLKHIAPGIVWVAALLANVLSLNRLFEQDHADGTLEQLIFSPAPLSMLIVGKVAAHWLLTGLPLTLLSPLFALQFDLPASSLLTLMVSLVIGTPVLSLIGAIAAGLTLGVRGGGVLVAVIVLPLYVPVLIFGAGSVDAAAAGIGASSHLSLLAALFLLASFFSPLATTAALRVALEY